MAASYPHLRLLVEENGDTLDPLMTQILTAWVRSGLSLCSERIKQGNKDETILTITCNNTKQNSDDVILDSVYAHRAGKILPLWHFWGARTGSIFEYTFFQIHFSFTF